MYTLYRVPIRNLVYPFTLRVTGINWML